MFRVKYGKSSRDNLKTADCSFGQRLKRRLPAASVILFPACQHQAIDSLKSSSNCLLTALRIACSDTNVVISGGRSASIAIEFALTRIMPQTLPGETKPFLGLNEKFIVSPLQLFEASLIVTPAGSGDRINFSRNVSIRRIASSLFTL